MKKLISSLLVGAMMLTILPAAFAADDLAGHWGKTYISYLSELEIMRPSADGSYKPDQQVTRAEFMRYINRAFHFTEKADISQYTDVAASDAAGNQAWYYEPVQIAVKQGYINGVSAGKMDPLGTVTREQAAAMICRLHKAEPTASTSRVSFTDNASIAAWSLPYIAQAIEDGYIMGYSDGSFKPHGTITRAELAKIMYSFMGTSLSTANVAYNSAALRTDTKNVTIAEPCTLSDVTVQGDLYITEGVLSADVALNNVTINGKLIVSGGNVTLTGVSVPELIVSSPTGRLLQITAAGSTNIGKTEIQTAATLRETGLDVSAGGFADLTLRGDQTPGVSLDASVWDLNVRKPASITLASGSSINTLTANAATTITGYGAIQKAVINKDGCNLSIQPGSTEIARDVTAMIAGVKTNATGSQAMVPNAYTYDRKGSERYQDFTLSAGTADVSRVTLGGDELKLTEDYTLTSNYLRLFTPHLRTIGVGQYTLKVYYTSGASVSCAVTVTDSSRNTVDGEEMTFDKNPDSSGYINVPITLTFTSSSTLNNVRINGTNLAVGTDYTFDKASGTVTLLREQLARRSTGTYTVTFVTNTANNPTVRLIIEDSSPKNALNFTSIDFDSNTDSGGYQDISVKLSAVNDAKLDYILATNISNRKLEAEWEYRIDGDQIILRKDTIATFAQKGYSYVDLQFSMSKGVSPTLRVNFVTTFALKMTVKDDLGETLSNVQITVTPTSSNSSLTAEQKITTNSDGIATAYVKPGEYTIKATGDQIPEALTRTVTINAKQSISLVAEIKEQLSIYVSDSKTGAPISGATVSAGGQEMITGTDGIATFTLKRGAYTVVVYANQYSRQSINVTLAGKTTERVKLDT